MGFIYMMTYNNIDLFQFKFNEIKKLYRFYIYLFKPNIWNLYKFLYKKIKYSKF